MSQNNDAPKNLFPTFRYWRCSFSLWLRSLPRTITKCMRVWWKCLCVCWKRNFRRVAFIGLFLVFMWTTANIYATFLLNREISAMRDRGEPTALAELAPSAVPDSQNAALLYTQADFLMTKLRTDNNPEWLATARQFDLQILTSSQRSNLRRFLQQRRSVIELTRRASRLPHCRFSTQWQGSASFLMLPHYAPLRELAFLMSVSAIYKLHNGQTQQAIEEIGVIYRMSAHAASEPMVISLLVSNAIEMIGHNTLAQALDFSDLTIKQKKEIEAILPRANQDQRFRKVMRGEQAIGLSLFKEIAASQVDITSIKKLFDSAENRETDFITSLSSSSIGRVIASPLYKLDTVWFLRANPANPHPILSTSVPVYAIVTKCILPSYSKTKSATQRAIDFQEMARIALALKLWKQTHKAYPKSLSELKSIPIESLPKALSRKTIGYKTQGDKFLLYGFGLNRRDDGGKSGNYDPLNPDKNYSDDNSDDLAWRQSLGVIKRNN